MIDEEQPGVRLRALTTKDQPMVMALVTEHWGSPVAVSRGVVYDPTTLPGIVAMHGDIVAGLAHYTIEGAECQIITIAGQIRQRGIGSALINRIIKIAREAGC